MPCGIVDRVATSDDMDGDVDADVNSDVRWQQQVWTLSGEVWLPLLVMWIG